MPPSQKPAQRLPARLLTSIRRRQAGARNNFDMFEPFPLLPIELRIKIWTACLPGPQIHSPVNNWDSFTLIHKPARDPITLQISRESREVTLKHYQLRSVYSLLEDQLDDKRGYAFYVDYSIDKFVFPSKDAFALSMPIKKIADIPAEKLDFYSNRVWNTFLSHQELRKLVNVQVFISPFMLTAETPRRLLRSWLDVWPALRLLTLTVYLDPDRIFQRVGGEVYPSEFPGDPSWVIMVKIIEFGKLVRDEMHKHRHEKLAEGVDWKICESKVEFVRSQKDRLSGRLIYEV